MEVLLFNVCRIRVFIVFSDSSSLFSRVKRASLRKSHQQPAPRGVSNKPRIEPKPPALAQARVRKRKEKINDGRRISSIFFYGALRYHSIVFFLAGIVRVRSAGYRRVEHERRGYHRDYFRR